MKKLITFAALAIVALLLAVVLWPKNQPTPIFSLADLNGRTITNAELKGKVTLINFWFPSSPGCISEMPKLIQTSHDYQSKDFQIIAISEPFDPLESVKNYAISRQLPFTVLYDADGAVGKNFGTSVYPTSFLINKDGELLKTYVGEPDFNALYQEINAELAK